MIWLSKFIYAFNESTKEELLAKGFRLLKNDIPFIFANDDKANFSEIESKDFCFSNVMQF